MTYLKTENESWGFYGTLDEHAEEAWPLAMAGLMGIVDNQEACRDFLDSRSGRHFGDSVIEGLECRGLTLSRAIKEAVGKWNNWTISKRHSNETGIPAGMPYLTGLLGHFEIELECAC